MDCEGCNYKWEACRGCELERIGQQADELAQELGLMPADQVNQSQENNLTPVSAS